MRQQDVPIVRKPFPAPHFLHSCSRTRPDSQGLKNYTSNVTRCFHTELLQYNDTSLYCHINILHNYFLFLKLFFSIHFIYSFILRSYYSFPSIFSSHSRPFLSSATPQMYYLSVSVQSTNSARINKVWYTNLR